MNKSVYKKIADFCEENRLIPENGKIIIGVSGGADSMALLHFLTEYTEKDRIIVCHINHGIRGDEALRDEEHVKNYCMLNSLRFEVLHADIPSLSKLLKKSEEECGRDERYKFFSSFAEDVNDRIATAHTLSDSCETMLFNMIKGAGIRGMRGILPVNRNIIRPLLCITREEVEEYCSENNLKYVTDSTNLSNDYSRNFVRHNIIPAVKEINPAFAYAFKNLSFAAQEDEKYFEKLSKKVIHKNDKTGKYFISKDYSDDDFLIKRSLLVFFSENGAGRTSFVQTELCADIIKKGNGEVSLSGNRKFVCEFGNFYLTDGQIRCIENSFSLPVIFSKVLTVGKTKVIINKVSRAEYEKTKKINNLFSYGAFDCDIISQDLILRNRCEGDIFYQSGNSFGKRLKKLFNEKKIPRSQRDSLLILDNCGEIVWLEGFGVSKKYKLKENSENIGIIKIDRGVTQCLKI